MVPSGCPLDVDRDRLLADLAELVRIPSINPALDPSGTGEAEVAGYIEGVLEGIGLEVERVEPAPGRPTVVGTLPGTGGGRSLMLNGHIDTVGVEGMADPFGAEVRGGRLYGRGAYDMKGAVAACIAAVRTLAAGPRLRGDVLLAAVCDEEHASLGTQAVLRRHRTDGAVVTEPTQLRVCVAHKGFAWIAVETIGKAAHGSRFREGVDANLRMGRVLHELEALAERLMEGPAHPLLGPGSLHAATLAGGTGLSTYAARCRLEIERRTLPGETGAAALEEVEAMLARLRARDPAFRAGATLILSRPPFEAAPRSPLVQDLSRAAAARLAEDPPLAGETYWMDAALLAEAGVDTVVFGPRGEGAHAASEWVDVRSLEDLAAILAATARAYCG